MESMVDVAPLRSEGKPLTRAHFVELVDKCVSEDDMGSFITLLYTLDGESLEAALPSLCDFATKCPKGLQSDLETVLLATVIDPNSTRGARKSSYSCLKVLRHGQREWLDFFVVVECLEEPQFHIIRPVLPRVDELLKHVSAGKFPWQWATVIFIRSLLHSNGWIRLWALEKAVEIDPRVLSANYRFLTDWIIPSINGNDLLWRLLERSRLLSFVDSLGELLNQIVLDSPDSSTFILAILTAVEALSCPVSFYYLASALQHIQRRDYLVDTEEHLLPLCRRVINRIHYIQFPSLRLTTSFLFVSFLADAVSWTPLLMKGFGSLLGSFSTESPGFLEQILTKLEDRWSSAVSKETFTASAMLQEILDDDEDSDFYRLLWLRASLSGGSSLLQAKLCLSLSEIFVDSQETPTTLPLLKALIFSPEPIDQGIVADVVGYVLLKVAVMEGKPSDFTALGQIYLPLLQKLAPEAMIRLMEALSPLAFSKDVVLPTERLALLCIVTQEVANGWKGQLAHLHPVVVKYLGEGLLTVPRSKRSSGLSAKEFAVILGDMQAARLDLYLRLLPFFSHSAESDVDQCISSLDCASTFAVKERLLSVIERRISEVNDSGLRLTALNAAAAVVNEEKKSQNCLPSIAKLFKIGMQKKMMSDSAVAERTKELFSEFSSTASLSLSVSLVLAHALQSAEEYLTADWAKEVLDIAVFGPVPKKDNRVLGAAFDCIYSGPLHSHLVSSELERVHEVVQRARMRAFSVAVRCSSRDLVFAVSLVNAILDESSELDKSSSKSFGLSLAHRQKTRVVSLLLFVVETVSDQVTLEAVFDHCLDCILDPCQQFSIKLVVEWIIVRICLIHCQFRERLIEAEKTLAVKRIGSISSWINTIVHLCRVDGSEDIVSRLISVVVPWTTAQNFAVRCSAIAGLRLMYGMLSADGQKGYAMVKRIVEFDSEPAGNSRRIIENLTGDFYFSFLHMDNHLDLQTVMIELPTKTGLPQEETIPLPLIQELNTSTFPSSNKDDPFLLAPSLVYAALSKSANCAPDIDVDPEDVDAPEQPETSFQKKILTKERPKLDDRSMIVVASLIDKPNNLGGLCRTSEIFGVDTLVLADLLMANDTGFKALSMSSEKWQHMEAVRPDQLLQYLEKLRGEGYTVIAAEQTTDSVPLHKFTFPKKCVLLMGDEKEGVPTRLLRAVDQTVEIEQLGQTRSLNVHVTAALFIAKYAEQMLL